jgi:hypothetical protein
MQIARIVVASSSKITPVAANAEAIAIAALKGPHVALARHGVAVKPGFDLRASVSGKGIEISRGAQREDHRFQER